jgi:hypothetical protein
LLFGTFVETPIIARRYSSREKRRQGDGTRKLLWLVAENLEGIHHLAVYVVVGFDGRRLSVEKHCSRTGKWLAVVMCLWEERRQPLQVAELATTPAENDEFPAVPTSWD